MMTLSAASDPRVTLRFAMMGSGTMLAMKRPPAGPPTPMPRSRRVSGRLGMGLRNDESELFPSAGSSCNSTDPSNISSDDGIAIVDNVALLVCT